MFCGPARGTLIEMRRFAVLLAAAIALAPTFEGAAAAEGGSPPWLGVAMGKEGGPTGVLVTRVLRGSPAAKAGLKDGDRILRIDGLAAESAADVTRAVRARPVGAIANVAVMRAGREVQLRATLTTAPGDEDLLRMDAVGAPARAWTGLKPVHGVMPTTVEGLRGKVGVVEFWATWCSACRAMAPTLEGWQARYGAQGLALVGISAEEPGLVAEHGERSGTRHGLAVDPEGQTTQSYGVRAMPTVFVLDKKGIVRDVFVGYDPARLATAQALVEKLLAEP